MLAEQITSRQNPLIKRAIQVRVGTAPGFMFVEGARLVDEAVTASTAIEAIIYTTAFAESDRGRLLFARVARTHFRGALVPEPIMRAICDTENPQGIVALAAHPRFELADALAGDAPLVVVLDGLQDPGNLGAIVRAAESAGASAVVTTPGTVEAYSPKALRASMGSAFRLPIVRRIRVDEAIDAARERGCSVLAALAHGEVRYTDADWRRPTVVLIGNEGAGLPPDTLALADETVSIPIATAVESLNAAMAATVLMFEAARQRSLDQ